MRKGLIAGVIGAAAVAAAVSVAPSANAYSGGFYYATTTVEWGGAPCIDVNEAYGASETYCGYGGRWQLDQRVYSGQDFGLDPVMGSADWISCQVYVDTRLVWSDYASRGDGTDVNCLRNKY